LTGRRRWILDVLCVAALRRAAGYSAGRARQVAGSAAPAQLHACRYQSSKHQLASSSISVSVVASSSSSSSSRGSAATTRRRRQRRPGPALPGPRLTDGGGINATRRTQSVIRKLIDYLFVADLHPVQCALHVAAAAAAAAESTVRPVLHVTLSCTHRLI